MSAPERIALLYDHTLQVGGVENLLLAMLRLADPREFTFSIYGQSAAPFSAQAEALGVQLVAWKRWLPFDVGAPFALARQFRQDRIDLVHCQAPIAAIYGRVAAQMAGIPALVTVHLPMDQYHGSGQWLRARLGRWLYTRLDTALNYRMSANLIYVSETVRQEQVRRRRVPLARTSMIAPGIDLAPYRDQPSRAELRAGLGISTEDLVVICVGRLSQEKGHETLLEAVAQLSKQGLSFRLWLVGDGPLRGTLETKARHLELGERVIFWGFRQDIPRLLGAADLFVLPSYYEIAPLSVLEALAAGLPIVSSATGEIPHWVTEGVEGHLVPPGDSSSLAVALNDLLSKPDLRAVMAEAARTRGDDFSAARMAHSIYDLYHLLLVHVHRAK